MCASLNVCTLKCMYVSECMPAPAAGGGAGVPAAGVRILQDPTSILDATFSARFAPEATRALNVAIGPQLGRDLLSVSVSVSLTLTPAAGGGAAVRAQPREPWLRSRPHPWPPRPGPMMTPRIPESFEFRVWNLVFWA